MSAPVAGVLLVVAAIAIAGVGIALGMLAAPRLSRLIDRDDEEETR